MSIRLACASLVIGLATVSLSAVAINRAFEQGRAVGKCDVVLLIDRAMTKRDPAFSAPDGLIARCKTIIKQADQ